MTTFVFFLLPNSAKKKLADFHCNWSTLPQNGFTSDHSVMLSESLWKPQFTAGFPAELNVFLLTEKYKVKRLISDSDYNSLCYCGSASALPLSLIRFPTTVLLWVHTHTHSHRVLSLLPSVYKLQQSHPSEPVDHEIRLRRKAVNDTGVATNENIGMRKCRSKTADAAVVTGVGNYISQLPPSLCFDYFSCCVLAVRTGH